MSKTKTFSNGFGSMDLTKDEYVRTWLNHAKQMIDLFKNADMMEEYFSMMCDIEDASAKMWDKQ